MDKLNKEEAVQLAYHVDKWTKHESPFLFDPRPTYRGNLNEVNISARITPSLIPTRYTLKIRYDMEVTLFEGSSKEISELGQKISKEYNAKMRQEKEELLAKGTSTAKDITKFL